MKSLTFSVEEFAASRRRSQDVYAERLDQFVKSAIETGDVDDLLSEAAAVWEEVFQSETDGELPASAVSSFQDAVRETLDKATPESDVQATSLMVASAAINSATMAAAGNEGLLLEWVTMEDEAVRNSHREVEGQKRPPGEMFSVAGVDMPYPGFPLAPIELWINCRCVLRPTTADEALTAAADVHDTTLCIMALPTPGDKAVDLSQEEAHATLVYFGDFADEDRIEEIADWVAQVAADAEPFSAKVSKVDLLGDDGALVWFLEDSDMNGIREGLLSDENLRLVHENADITHYPTFTPHVTIGYDIPLSGDAIDSLSSVEEITFDRLSVWHGSDRTDYPLGGDMPENEPVEEVDEVAPDEEITAEDAGMIPWHGVLAVEGRDSGDSRYFEKNSLTHRVLSDRNGLPLTWQEISAAGHDDAVTIGGIAGMGRDSENRIWGWGWIRSTEKGDEVTGLLAEFGKFGVSIDADDAVLQADDETNLAKFAYGRIASACVVNIPALPHAWVGLGEIPQEVLEDLTPLMEAEGTVRETAEAQGLSVEEYLFGETIEAAISEEPWDGSASRFTPEQWYNATLIHLSDDKENKSDHKLPIKEPNGDLSRAGVHAAAARLNQTDAPPEQISKAKAALRSAYKELGEEAPEAVEASIQEILASIKDRVSMKRGPGWITHPRETRRIHAYWTKPGQPGYAKIGWGAPGDFNRCRTLVGEKIAKNSPEDTRFLNQICAQWHHDALGIWPGEHHASVVGEPDEKVNLISLTASADSGWDVPADWFERPDEMPEKGFTITDEGRTFGYLAEWGVCHIGIGEVCVEAPTSPTDYAYFATGVVTTKEGRSVPVGSLTVGTGHADGRLRARPAAAHYDNTGSVWAYVNVGEDERGIWFSGMVKPGTDPDIINTVKASGRLSGDWREIAGEMELVAALTVNVPGFPLVSAQATVLSGRQNALIAAGVVSHMEPEDDPQAPMNELAAAIVDEMEARQARRTRLAALKEKVSD